MTTAVFTRDQFSLFELTLAVVVAATVAVYLSKRGCDCHG